MASFEVEKFVMVPTDKGTDPLDLRPYMVNDGLSIDHDLEDGGWQLTASVADPQGYIRKHPIFGDPKGNMLPTVDVNFDDAWWRLRSLSRNSDDTLSLIFQDRNIDRLARKRKSVVTGRDKATRREFIVARVRDTGVKAIYSPEEHEHKRILSPEEEQLHQQRQPDPNADASGGRDLGTFDSTAYGPPWEGIQGTGTTANGTDLTKSPKVYGVAIDPSVLKLNHHYYIWPNPFDHKGSFVAFDTGGAIKGNRIDFYDWRGRTTQNQWGHQNVRVSESPNFATTDSNAQPMIAVPYQFKVGVLQDDGTRENWWEGIMRLSDETRIRSFFDRNRFICMSETELSHSTAVATINASDKSIISISWDFDNGAEEKSMDVELLCERWAFPPGASVIVEGEGRFDGRYIVASKQGNAFDADATISLRRALSEKPEPAHDVKPAPDDQSESTSGDGSVEGLRQICQTFNGSYNYGGGHGPALSTLKVTDDLDCSSSTSLALFKAGLWGLPEIALVSGDFDLWGEAGEGKDFTVWYNAEHVFIKFSDGNEFNTAYHPSVSGPRFGKFGHPTAGFSPRKWTG